MKSEYRLSAFQEGWPESGTKAHRVHQPHHQAQWQKDWRIDSQYFGESTGAKIP